MLLNLEYRVRDSTALSAHTGTLSEQGALIGIEGTLPRAWPAFFRGGPPERLHGSACSQSPDLLNSWKRRWKCEFFKIRKSLVYISEQIVKIKNKLTDISEGTQGGGFGVLTLSSLAFVGPQTSLRV